MTSKLRVLGIDPAPAKGLVVFDPAPPDGEHYTHVDARRARDWLGSVRAAGRLLIGWDAPIFADFTSTYTARPVERFLGKKLGKAVSVQGFSGCQHWTISLDVLGRPLPQWLAPSPDKRLPLLLPGDDSSTGGVMETHPAVALLLLWGQQHDDPMPVYKKSLDACRKIESAVAASLAPDADVRWTQLPERMPAQLAGRDPSIGWDDVLDAQVSYACVALAVRRRAILLGDESGGFVVPKTERAEQLQREFEAWRDKQKDARKQK